MALCVLLFRLQNVVRDIAIADWKPKKDMEGGTRKKNDKKKRANIRRTLKIKYSVGYGLALKMVRLQNVVKDIAIADWKPKKDMEGGTRKK